MAKIRQRGNNFLPEETQVLVLEVVAREDMIKKPLSGNLTYKMKRRAWECVAEKVNAVCGRQRDVEAMRQKLRQEKCRVKKKASKQRRYKAGTGGGPAPPPLEDWEDVLLDFIGDEVVTGVEGGLETPVKGTSFILKLDKICRIL